MKPVVIVSVVVAIVVVGAAVFFIAQKMSGPVHAIAKEENAAINTQDIAGSKEKITRVSVRVPKGAKVTLEDVPRETPIVKDIVGQTAGLADKAAAETEALSGGVMDMPQTLEVPGPVVEPPPGPAETSAPSFLPVPDKTSSQGTESGSMAVLPIFTPITNTTGPSAPVAAAQTTLPSAGPSAGAQPQDIASFVPVTNTTGPIPGPGQKSEPLPAFTPVSNTTGPTPSSGQE
jgi:hypothetical protein